MSDAAVQQEISLESLVAQVVDEFRERQKRGERPDVEEYTARHPQAAELLRKVLASWQLIGMTEAGALAPQDAAPDEPVSGILGDFRLLREVGRGGMGVVYEAEQISLGRRVALKVLPFAATMDSRQLQRFQNEARAAAGLHHTNIVPVHYVGSERGVHYYAMQYIEGCDLASIIAQLREQSGRKVADSRHLATVDAAAGEAVTPAAFTVTKKPLAGLSTERSTKATEHFRAVARLGIQAAEALDHAHQMGIVHRDVKPANLLVDETGRLWITDFGLAQFQSDTRLTMTGDLVGTLRYMSPEQALAQRVIVDHRTDIYSLGATFYELLTLEPAFTGNDRQELLRQIAFEEPIRPRRLNRAIPPELETIVLKALERNPQDRYATAQELADDLERFVKDEPIRARRPSLMQRARKWTRRHKAVVWAVAAVLLVSALLGGGVGAWWLQQRMAVEQQRAAAVREAEVALEDADRLQKAGKLPEALWAIRRAESLRTAGLLNDQLAQRVQERQTDLEMLDRIEDIRLQQIAMKDGHFEEAPAETAYQLAFRDYGIDVLRLDPKEAAERIKIKSIRVELATALLDWVMIGLKTNREIGTTSKTLLAIARAVDPDDWRNQVYDALEQRDRKTLIELAASAKVAELSPTMLVLLGKGLLETRSRNEAAALLRKAQRQYPGDFWINQMLAISLLEIPREKEEALAFARVALALRPHNPHLHFTVSRALSAQGRHEEAGEEILKAYALDPRYVGASLALGRILENEGRLLEAEQVYHKAIALEPEKRSVIELHIRLASLLNEQGRFREALAELDHAARLKPREAPFYYKLFGQSLYKQDHLEEAKELYRKVSALQPQVATWHLTLGIILYRQGQLEEAKQELQTTVQLTSLKEESQRASTLLRNCERLLGLRQRLPGLIAERDRPANQAERLDFAYLCALPSERHYALAARLYADAFVAEPKLADDRDAQPRYNAACAAALAGCGQDVAKLDDKEKGRLRQQALTWLQADQQRWAALVSSSKPDRSTIQQALKHWQRDADLAGVRGEDAIAKLPEEERHAWRQLWTDVADTLLKTDAKTPAEQQREDKIAEYRKALELDPDDAKAHNSLGDLLLDQNKRAEAEKEYRKAISLNPKLPAPYHGLGNVLQTELPKDAAVQYRRAIALDPKDGRYHCGLGRTLWWMYLLDEAVEEFQKAIECDRTQALYHYSLGYTLAEQGKWAEGEAEYRKAIELDPLNAKWHNFFGVFLRGQGRFEEATAEFRKAIELASGEAYGKASTSELGHVLKDMGLLEEARREWLRCRELQAPPPNSTTGFDPLIQTCEQQIALRPRLPALAAGKDQPANPAERLAFALLCQEPFERRYALSAQLYADAFAADPKLADDLNARHCYSAACAAALAGCGQGENTPKLDDKEKSRLRNQALAWLQADQQRWAVQMSRSTQPWFQVRELGRWQIAPDLAGVRDDAIAKLPQEEQEAWRQLWTDIADTLKKAREKTAPDPKSQKKP